VKIALLAKRHSIHTVRWVNALAARGHQVYLISSVRHGEPLHDHVRFHPLPLPPPAGFFLNVPALRSLLRRIRPDVLNTHYASGYGTLARLSGFTPNVLSVWGADVYDFPATSPLHRRLIRDNLRAADHVCSTSEAMARKTTSLHAVEHLDVVPFGIDCDAFAPGPAAAPTSMITIGTVKTLAAKYGVDVLIRAFAVLRRRLADGQPEHAAALRLRIVGGGPDEAALRALARDEGVFDATDFVGQVPHSDVPSQLRRLDVYVALSRRDSESFGVAVLEASAVGLPVVASDVGGLPEVVVEGVTGFVVPREDVDAAADRLHGLVVDADLRRRLGDAGRMRVQEHYAWPVCVERMEGVYRTVVARHAQAGAVAP
jgi:L-malate glycosyltransferase